MFIKVLIYYIKGYVRIAIEGYYMERFINICTNQKILIWNLKREKNVCLHFNVGIQEFKKIARIARKTKCKLKIEKKQGVPFILNKYRKRKIFLILLAVVCFCIYFSSQYIWNIEIREESNQELANLEQDLKEAGLAVGTLKGKTDTKEVINKIRLKRNDIAWMGIELNGTNAIVKVVKTEEKPDIIDKDEYCNIVSDKDGVITKINAQKGTAQVKIGDTVKKGTILIAGWMEGKYTGMRYVHSQGEIEAKVWYTKTKWIPFKQEIREKTGNTENKYGIKLNNFQINLHKGVSKFKIYDTINTEKKCKIFSNLYLPIAITKTVNEEVKTKQVQYTLEEAKSMGIKQIQEEIENQISNKDSIKGKTVNCKNKKDGVEVQVTYEVLENIGTNEKIVF